MAEHRITERRLEIGDGVVARPRRRGLRAVRKSNREPPSNCNLPRTPLRVGRLWGRRDANTETHRFRSEAELGVEHALPDGRWDLRRYAVACLRTYTQRHPSCSSLRTRLGCQ